MFYCSGIVAYYVKGDVYGCQICSILYSDGKSDFLVIFRCENTLLE